MEVDPNADDVGLHQKVGPVDRRTKEVRSAAIGKQRIILHRSHDVLGGILDRMECHQIVAP